MGLDLLACSPAFAAAVGACAAALQPLGVDLLPAFSQNDGFSNPVLAAIGLTAIQACAHNPGPHGNI
jgi:hypothetical protein